MQKAFEEIYSYKPDWIVAIGGGSTIDFAKLCWLFYEHPDLDEDQISRNFSVPPLRGKCRFIAVPTTAGTGSEMSSSAVFQNDENDRKKFVVTHDFLPDIAILDPRFILNTPKKIKINSAFDALAHSIEGYVSLFRNEHTQDLASIAIKKIFSNLEMYVNSEEHIEPAHEILRAANYAGIVQNISIPGIGHAFSHEVSKYQLNHGFSCGSFLPIAMKINLRDEKVKKLYDKLANELGFHSSHELLANIEMLRDKYDLYIGKDKKNQIKLSGEIMESIKKDPTARANPVGITNELLEDFYQQIV